MSNSNNDGVGQVLQKALQELGADAEAKLAEVKQAAITEAAKLTPVIGQPGYLEALEASADSIALMVSTSGVNIARAQDARFVGTIHGILTGLATKG